MSTTNRTTFTITKEAAKFNVQDQGEGKLPLLTGYALAWNTLSDDRGGYRVRLLPNSAKPLDPCFALANHDYACVMGGTENGTLTITSDDYGMKFTVDPADTSYSRDMIALIRRGDVKGMSFGMPGADTAYREVQEGGQTVRDYSSFTVDEISFTAIPAFTGTSVASEFTQAATPGTKPQTPAPTPLRNKMGVELEEIRFQYIRG